MIDPAVIVARAVEASGFPLRLDATSIKKIQSDFRRLTKIYRSIPTDLESDPDLSVWNEARKIFAQFGSNLEEWVYKVLIRNSRPQDDNWAQRQVREKAWSLIIELRGGSLFPSSWDYKTKEHEPAPWELKSKRSNNIQRYQRLFRDFITSLEEYVRNEGGGAVDLPPMMEKYQISGMNVVVYSLDREGRDHGMDDFLRDMGRQARSVSAAGFASALRGLTVAVRFDEHGMTAGSYSPDIDILTMFPLGHEGGKSARTFVHEVGHRYYFKIMSPRAQKHWEEVLTTQTVEVTPKAISEFVSAVVEKTPKADRRERERFVERLQVDPETKAVFRYLADHFPVLVDTPQDIEKHFLKFNVGDKALIEHITDYGAEHPYEAFAEAFQLYVGKGPRALGPWTRSFFERLVRSKIAALHNDKAIRDASLEVYNNLPNNLQHEVDEFLRGMIMGVAPRLERFNKELYDAYEPVRKVVRKRYGGKVTLYRGEPRDKPTLKRKFLSWTPSWKMATRFAGDPDYEIVEAEVRSSDVVAVFVSPHNDAYVEYVVRERPEYHKQSENQVPWIGYITMDDEDHELGFPEETVLNGQRGYWDFDPDHARKEFSKIERAVKSVGGKVLREFVNEDDEAASVTVALPADVETQDVRGDLMAKVGPYWVETLRKYTGYNLPSKTACGALRDRVVVRYMRVFSL